VLFQRTKRCDTQLSQIRQFDRLLAAVFFPLDLDSIFARPHEAFSVIQTQERERPAMGLFSAPLLQQFGFHERTP